MVRALLLSFALAAVPALAQTPDPSPHSEAALVTGAASVRPGESVEVALRLRLDDGWHAYWLNPGDSGLPVAVEWTLPAGATAGPLLFPPPKRYTLAGLTSYAHEGEAYFFTTIAVPDDLAGPLTIAGEATWLVCADVCLPARESVSLTIPLGDGAGRTSEAARLDAARTRLPRAAEGWTMTAARADGGYLLTIAPPPGVDLDGAMFFPSEAPVLDHAAEQSFTREGGAWAARLTDSDYAERPAERLRGVLVAASGEAVEIDAAVASDEMADRTAGNAAGGSMAWMLLLALGGGMLLNLMPCVFPVLSLKILGIAQGGTARELRRHGLAFGAGVVVSFLALAALLLALRAGGAALGWGFQLQSPPVVAALAALMVVLALGLFGVVEIGTSLASNAARADRASGLGGAFASGVLATAVASPCTAPMMGAALGWALAQPPAAALLVFATLGVGMALPFVALSFAPGLAARLPRPGPWMESLKQALAFPLLATAVWLVWVFGRQTGTDGAAALLLALVALAFGVWVLGRYPAVRVSTRVRLASRLFVALVVAGAVALVGFATGAGGGIAVSGGAIAAGEAASPDGWQPYATARVERLVAEGRPVFVDYTAAWCLTCQVNKRTTLRTDAVERAFAEAGVVRVEADWTDRSEEIERSLARFGRSGVPLYVLYPGGGAAPVVLPEVLTPGIVLAALADAGRGTRGGDPE